MTHEFERAWHEFTPGKPPYVHPRDGALLEGKWADMTATLDDYMKNDFPTPRRRRLLHLNLLPTPFMGRLRTARVYFLLSNPGLTPCAYFAELEMHRYREALIANLKGESPFLFLDPTFAWLPGFAYWHKKLGRVIKMVHQELGQTYTAALRYVAERVAVIDLVPYHSVKFRLPKVELRSTELAKAYVRDVVIPRAKAGEALLVVMRKRGWEERDFPKKCDNVVVYSDRAARGAQLDSGTRVNLERQLRPQVNGVES